MQKLVSYFDFSWSRRQQAGSVWLTFDDRTIECLEALERDELALICSILRAEKNVYYDTTKQELSTRRDPIADSVG